MTGYYLKKLSVTADKGERNKISSDWKLSRDDPSILTYTLYQDRYYGIRFFINGHDLLVFIPICLHLKNPRYYIFKNDSIQITKLIADRHFIYLDKNFGFETLFSPGIVDMDFARFSNEILHDGTVAEIKMALSGCKRLLQHSNDASNVKATMKLLHKLESNINNTYNELEEM